MQREFILTEYRYGFSFPWNLLSETMQEAITNWEEKPNRILEDCYWGELESCFKSEYYSLGGRIAGEIAERYGFRSPNYH